MPKAAQLNQKKDIQMATATRSASSNQSRPKTLFICLIGFLFMVAVFSVGIVNWLQERSSAAAMWTPERIELIRSSTKLRQDLAELNELCRGFEKQICIYAYKASRTIREADLEEKNAQLSEMLQRGRP